MRILATCLAGWWNASPGQPSPFLHGVASGDPTAHSVLLWTRVEPSALAGSLVEWEVAADSLFTLPAASGTAVQDPERNGCITVACEGLEPSTWYFYRFRMDEIHSPTGRTKTAPAGTCGELKFGVVSCANFEAGYYNAYRHLGRRNDLDAIIHLGDYIYEYPAGRYTAKLEGRSHRPANECITLDDYRTRYAQYRSDPDLQFLHSRYPVIAIWDDHEFANDAHAGGAQNHQPETEGGWLARRDAARQAYFEWIPVRQEVPGRLYRTLHYGNLATLWLPDERLEGRSEQATDVSDPLYRSPERSILGPTQTEWLESGMQESNSTWRILCNQVILSSIEIPPSFPGKSKYMDMWDGYPVARDSLLAFALRNRMNNLVVITGDSHTSWAIDLCTSPQAAAGYGKRSCTNCLGAEFTTPSITSANYDEYVPRWKARLAEWLFTRGGRNPHVRFRDLRHHGYLLLTLTPEAALGQWILMRSILKPSLRVKKKTGYALELNSPILHRSR